jgi:hypothetical protein
MKDTQLTYKQIKLDAWVIMVLVELANIRILSSQIFYCPFAATAIRKDTYWFLPVPGRPGIWAGRLG